MNYVDPNSKEGQAKMRALDALLELLNYAHTKPKGAAAPPGAEASAGAGDEQEGDDSEELPEELQEVASMLEDEVGGDRGGDAGDQGDAGDEKPGDALPPEKGDEEEPKAFMTIDMEADRRKPPSRFPVKKKGRA